MSWMKDSQDGAQLKHQAKAATDVPRQSCSNLVATMQFLATGEKTGCAAGCLSEADGSGPKIDEGVAVHFSCIIQIDGTLGSLCASGRCMNKWLSGKGFG